ncbi:tautomerase family protein [Pseudonocardia xinjiangensis]|uniref:tautomerase family protein n=1 Tax=Pseudonocardia xinjiangensis TaxID=75289 RepID=UPI003D8C25C8
MPLWHVYHSETIYAAEDKQALADRISDLYVRWALPKFYVSVIFHKVPSESFYIGGRAVSNYVRIWVDHVARKLPDDLKEKWMEEVDDTLAPFVRDRGLDWEIHIDETPKELWTINGVTPPPEDSDEERRWAEENRPSAPIGS